MKLNELAPSPGAKKVRRRLGRGLGSGRGKTAGRGQKGQKSRSGYSKKAAWEGGRSRLIARLPKRGFTGKGEVFQVVNLSDLNAFEAGTTVTVALLRQHGMVRKVRQPVKLLGGGELTVSNLRVEVDAYSATAIQAIQAAGGSVVGVKENS